LELVLAKSSMWLAVHWQANTVRWGVGVVIAGWASNSKYAFIGSLCLAAQIVSAVKLRWGLLRWLAYRIYSFHSS